MGICIGYSGRLNSPGLFDEMVQDVRLVSTNLRWRCTDVEKRVSGLLLEQQTGSQRRAQSKRNGGSPRLVEETLRGLYVTPPDTETLQLLFDSKGRLCYYQEIPLDFITGPIVQDMSYYMPFPLWVKTTGALDSHIFIVILLERLQRKFMKNLKITDDTGFAKTRNFDRLVTEHAAMSLVIQSLQETDFARMLLAGAGVDLPKDAVLTHLPSSLPSPSAKPKRPPAKIN